MTRKVVGTHHPRVAPMHGQGGLKAGADVVPGKQSHRVRVVAAEQAFHAAIDAEAEYAAAEAAPPEAPRPAQRKRLKASRLRIEREYDARFPDGAKRRDADSWAIDKSYSTTIVRQIHRDQARRPPGRPPRDPRSPT